MAQPSDSQAVVQTGPVDPSSVKIHFTVAQAAHDENEAYSLSKAIQTGMKYLRAILRLQGDSTNWFSLYEVIKKSPTRLDALTYIQPRSYEFETMTAAIEWVEDMLKICGYELTRRPNFNDAAYLLPVQTAHDMSLMMSLLLAEFEWESSVMQYRNPKSGFTPRFHVCSDVPHTPQTKPNKPRPAVEDTSSGSDVEPQRRSLGTITRKLDFESSDDSGVEKQRVKPNLISVDPLVDKVADGVAKLIAKGELTIDEASRILRAVSSTEQQTKAPSSVRTAKTATTTSRKRIKFASESDMSSDDDESGYSSFEVAKRRATKKNTAKKQSRRKSYNSSDDSSSSEGESGYSSIEADKRRTKKREKYSKRSPRRRSSRKSDFDVDMDLSSSDEASGSDRRSRRRDRHVTTVIQSSTPKPFSGSKVSPEEARQWLNKQLHFSDISNLSDRQKRKAMTDAFTGQAKHWERQLPAKTRKSWKRLLRAFYKKYCKETTPAALTYYRLTQKQDESVLDFLYRFNVAGIRAQIDFRVDEDDEDPDREPTELQNHVQQFFDSLHEKDKVVQNQFRYNKYRSIDKLEEKLAMYENNHSKPPVKKSAAKKHVEDTSEQPAAVAKINNNGDKRGRFAGTSGGQHENAGDSQQHEIVKCENCGKNGHTKETCFQLQTCPYCKKLGHTLKYCRSFLDKLTDITISNPRVASGETSIDDLLADIASRSN